MRESEREREREEGEDLWSSSLKSPSSFQIFSPPPTFLGSKKSERGKIEKGIRRRNFQTGFLKQKRGQSACVRVYESERERVGMKNDDKEKDEKSECV